MDIDLFSSEKQKTSFMVSAVKLNQSLAVKEAIRELSGPGGGGTLGISGWVCAAGTLEPLTYTRASSVEFCYPILE